MNNGEKKEYRYIQFPLSFLRTYHSERKETITKILLYGIYKNGERLKSASLYEIAREINEALALNYLSERLQKEYSRFIDLSRYSFDYSETSNEAFVKVMQGQSELQKMSYEYYKVIRSMKFHNLELKPEILEGAIKTGKDTDIALKGKNDSMVMVKTVKLLEFLNEDKADIDYIVFAFYIAFRSIIGKKPLAKKSREFIVARAIGSKSLKVLPSNLPENLKDFYRKYCTEYHFNKIKDKLIADWKMIQYPGRIDGICYSFLNKLSVVELIRLVQSQKEKNRIKRIKEEGKRLLREVLYSA